MAAANIGYVLSSFTDTLIVGRIGVTELASMAFAGALIGALIVSGVGILTSVPIAISQACGTHSDQAQLVMLRTVVWFSLTIGAVLALFLFALNALLAFFGQSHAVVSAARPFLVIAGSSMIPELSYLGVKGFCDSLGKPLVPMCIQYAAVAINPTLGWILAFGKLGVPRLGLEGVALALLSSSIFSALAVTVYALVLIGGRPIDLWPLEIDLKLAKTFTRLGLPGGLQQLSEIAAFNFAIIMMGWLGAKSLAAHEIALTCITLTYRIPLGVSNAVTVRIGHAIGKKRQKSVRKIAFGAILLSVCVMSCFAAAFLCGGRWIAKLFTLDSDVIAITISLLAVAGAFQIADGIQVTAAGRTPRAS